MKVRKATLEDLDNLVKFTAAEAQDAEGLEKSTDTLRKGIKAALLDDSIAMYWILLNEKGESVGSVSALKEWSDWNAGFYWWIQSMFITPQYRGKGLMALLIEAVRDEMALQKGLELRLYVHENNQPAINAYRKSGFSSSSYQIMTFQDS